MTKYRMLEEGEVIQVGDEYKCDFRGWQTTCCGNAAVRVRSKGKYRRPIDKKDDMDGWRMLSGDEVAQEGDEYRCDSRWPWQPVFGALGKRVNSLAGEVRRKVEDPPVKEDYAPRGDYWPAPISDLPTASDPDHYKQGDIECIDYIKSVLSKEGYIGYLQGNITKYLHRWKDKNGLEDLDKAQVYLNWLIKEVEEDGEEE